MNSGEGERQPASSTHNELSGVVRGTVVQTGSVGQITFHDGGSDFPVPSQLPPPPRFFTSRDTELAELRGWLDENDEQPLLAVLSGGAGVGKTTLALRWLYDVREHFPDGQLYIDLGAFSGNGPIEPEEALEYFLVALGISSKRIPLGLPTREALYRSLTADRSVAVLLDDAMSAAQVRPLLPSSSRSAAIVTSRWRLSGLSPGGARFVEVDPLTVRDSVELLKQVVGDHRTTAEHAQAEELAKLCGGLPIALSVVGARLSARPRRSLSKEVVDLRDKDRLAVLTLPDEVSIGVVFDMSYEALPDEQARVYRLCALHSGTKFGVDAAAAMAGQPVDDIEPALDALLERNLLTEVADRRFRYHDLLRIHARQQANRTDSESERVAVVRRMVEWYLDTMVAADLLLRPTRRRVGPRFQHPPDRSSIFGNHQEALGWLELERGNLVQAARSAVERDWDDLVWEFCEATWGFMAYFRFHGEWLNLYYTGVSAARRCGHLVAEARLRTQLGSTLTFWRRYDEAIEVNLVALRLAEQAGDEFTRATALAELAAAARGKGDTHSALDYLHRATRIREVIGTARSLAQCRRQIGEVLTDLGRYEDAVAELIGAAEAIPGRDIERARVLTRLGTVYLRWGHLADAAAPLTEALDIATELGSIPYQADIQTALGELAEHTSDLTAARAHFSAAYEYYSRDGDPMAAEVAGRLARLSTSRM